MRTVFEAAGGMDGLRRLADAWHRRVMADEVVAHAFSHGFHPQHSERLAAYWAEALGGPAAYSDSYGDETTVVKIHSVNRRVIRKRRQNYIRTCNHLLDGSRNCDSALTQCF